ncbi:MAG: ribokinase, partial [Bacteroidales bacterium]|nr:ribokinase [Bacteroidales bacterium]
MKPRILVIGSANVDMIVKVPHIPRPGETILGGDFFKVQGGKGANQAVAAARAGGSVTFAGCVGNDSLGTDTISCLKKEGIDVGFIKISPDKPTGVALINVAATGENSISVAPGANYAITQEDIQAIEHVIAKAQIVLLQHEIPFPAISTAIEIAFYHKIPVILNPAPAFPIAPDLLSKIAFLTPNEHEAAMITGHVQEDEKDPRRLAAQLIEMGCRQIIITLGEKGALYASASKIDLIPGFPVKAVDTTAAGDTFNGYLAVAIARGKPIQEAIRLANKAASVSVTRMGAQSSIPVLS